MRGWSLAMRATRRFRPTPGFRLAWWSGHPELTPLSPSEEHLPLAVAEGAAGPQIGDALYLLPRHVCPTVNNFDCALLVRDGKIEAVENVSARGREAPLLQAVRIGTIRFLFAGLVVGQNPHCPRILERTRLPFLLFSFQQRGVSPSWRRCRRCNRFRSACRAHGRDRCLPWCEPDRASKNGEHTPRCSGRRGWCR